jgi:hypothetical protein
MSIRSDISSVFYLLLLGDVADYSPFCGQLYRHIFLVMEIVVYGKAKR